MYPNAAGNGNTGLAADNRLPEDSKFNAINYRNMPPGITDLFNAFVYKSRKEEVMKIGVFVRNIPILDGSVGLLNQCILPEFAGVKINLGKWVCIGVGDLLKVPTDVENYGFINMSKIFDKYSEKDQGISKYDCVFRVPNEILLSILCKSVSKAKIYEPIPECYSIEIKQALQDTIFQKLVKEL